MIELKGEYFIDRYCSELGYNFIENLPTQTINLISSKTNTGKSVFFIGSHADDKVIGVTAPFTALSEQIYRDNPSYKVKKGLKAQTEGTIELDNGRITSFHSAERLLELKHLDYLIIDELHEMINYAGFSPAMIGRFWETVDKLKEMHPNLVIIALSGTPQFLRYADFLDMNLYVINLRDTSTQAPSKIEIKSSWLRDLNSSDKYLYLYNTRKNGRAWANRFDGGYIESAIKEKSKVYEDIVKGKMSHDRIFTSTLLATGVSILEPVDYIYTNWVDLVAIVQLCARPRVGRHILRVTKIKKPVYMRHSVWEMKKPELVWTDSYKDNFILLHKYQEWYSCVAHQDEDMLREILYTMLFQPAKELPSLEELWEKNKVVKLSLDEIKDLLENI